MRSGNGDGRNRVRSPGGRFRASPDERSGPPLRAPTAPLCPDDTAAGALPFTAWYPTAEQPVGGVFVREHAKAVSLYDDVVVVHLAGLDPTVRWSWAIEEETDAELTEETRFDQGHHLHQRLGEVCADLWEIDVSAPGIAFLREHGFSNLLVGDVCDPGTLAFLRASRFDAVVASEVIEHLTDLGTFFQSLRAGLAETDTELLVTAPNAFRVATLLKLFSGVELVHPDHNYRFSYQTLRNTLSKSGFRVDEMYVYSFESTRLLPVPFRRSMTRWNERGVSRADRTGCENGRGSVPSRARVATYVSGIPRSLLVGALYRTTPFWGDGLIACGHADPEVRVRPRIFQLALE